MLETYVLHITKECNMQCVYCYEQDKTSVYSWENIKEVLDNIVKYNQYFTLEFLGGEPCLRTDFILKVFNYLESQKNIHVNRYAITTNGTIVDDTIIGLLKNNTRVSWTASMDGCKFANCLRTLKTGKNSYDLVIDNFKKLKILLNDDKNEQLGIHPVTHHYNIALLNKSIETLYHHGVRRFGIGTVESTLVIDDDYCNEFIKQLNRLSDRILAGEFPGIHIGLLEGLKPKSDSRHYIRDEDGKTLLETYGRTENDIKDHGKYKTPSSSSSIGDTIYNIRETVYNYHQKNLGKSFNGATK